MTGFIEDNTLRFMGLDNQDIADLNAALPESQRAVELLEAWWPKIAPLVATALPVIAALSAEYPKIEKHVPNLLRIARKLIAKQRALS